MKTFIEDNCTIEHEGESFISGGAYLLQCTDRKYRGVVYVDVSNMKNWRGYYHGKVTNWHGDFIADCRVTYYQGNFCHMARLSFELDGRKFIGDYCPDWAQACKVRSTK